MRRMAWGCLLAGALAGGAAQAQALDGLLDSLADSCQASPVLAGLLHSLGRADGDGVRQPAQLAAPPDLAEAFGPPDRVRINAHTWLLGAPVRGSWHGVPVTALTRTLHLDGPGGEFAVELEGSPQAVQAALGQALVFRHSRVAVDGAWQARGAQFVPGVNSGDGAAVVCPLPF